MPYIVKLQREYLDDEIVGLAEQVLELDFEERGGALNYIFTKLLLEVYGRRGYYITSQAVATLECCKLEWYRRVMSKYEDEKIIENGDIK